ncbi:hypothetical protein AB0F81_25955 [Actinoplanes sp. NPDC024001]|uniref:hypothetical protein n=1 Tax=Actinoplanes sp. NPDC024001 TaxID=3154598 RepID=UPI0033C96E4D
MKDLDSLAVLDPARGREPSAAEWRRSQAYVEKMMQRPGRAVARRWLPVGVAAAGIGAVLAVAVPALVPGAAEKAVASWTAMPASRTGEQVLAEARACGANDVGGTSATVSPSDVLLAEQRGEATLLIMRKENGTVVECLSAGDDQFASMGLADAAGLPTPPRGTVTLETMSALGDGDGQWSNIVGLAGPEVTAVEVRLDSGKVFQASVKAGWWGAWWPGPAGGEVDALTVIVHTADGTTELRPSDLP